MSKCRATAWALFVCACNSGLVTTVSVANELHVRVAASGPVSSSSELWLNGVKAVQVQLPGSRWSYCTGWARGLRQQTRRPAGGVSA